MKICHDGLSPGPPKYEGVLRTQLRYFVILWSYNNSMQSGRWVPTSYRNMLSSSSTSVLQMETGCPFETLVPTYHTAWCHNPGDRYMKVIHLGTKSIQFNSIYLHSVNPDTGRHRRIWNKSNTI